MSPFPAKRRKVVMGTIVPTKAVNRLTLLLLCGVIFQPGGMAQISVGSSPHPTGSGARAMGMGNAFVAAADDATAASWNPAAMLRLEDPELSFAWEWGTRHGEIDGVSGNELLKSDQDVSFSDLNYLSLVVPLAWERKGERAEMQGLRFSISINYFKQYRYDQSHDFPYIISTTKDGLTLSTAWRHMADQDGSLATLSPAIAIGITDRFFAGLAVNIWNDSVTQASSFTRQELTLGTTTIALAPGIVLFEEDVKVWQDNTYTVDEGYSLTFGLLYLLPGDSVTLGAVVKPGFKMDMEHKRYISTDDPAYREIEAELEMPTSAAFGIMYRPTETWFVTADLTWTEWSGYLLREDRSGNGVVEYNPVTDMPLASGGLGDTWTVRLGAEYRLFLSAPEDHDLVFIPLRCGMAYDPVPAVGGADDAYTISLGTGYATRRLCFDLAYEFRWGNSIYAGSAAAAEMHEKIRQHRIMASVCWRF